MGIKEILPYITYILYEAGNKNNYLFKDDRTIENLIKFGRIVKKLLRKISYEKFMGRLIDIRLEGNKI